MAEGKENVGVTQRRLLALEIRPRRFGFVVLDRLNLLDWGVRECGGALESLRTLAGKKFTALREIYGPELVAIRKRRRRPLATAARRIAEITAAVRRESKKESTAVRFLSATKVESFFARYGCANKHETAKLLAEWFEELTWKLPAKRKPWQSERYNTLLFDALATAMAFLGYEMA